jgi:hypothetical protein
VLTTRNCSHTDRPNALFGAKETGMTDRKIDIVDIDDSPEVIDLIERSTAGNAPFILRRAGKMVGVIAPIGFDESVEHDEERSPSHLPRRRVYAENLAGFLSAFGAWKDLVDGDKLIEDIYRWRAEGSRDRDLIES